MNHSHAILLAVLLVGPSFAGCTDGGQEDTGDKMDRLVAQADKCDPQMNSDTPGGTPASGTDGIFGDLGYATDADRTLLRWTPPQGHDNATYTVTRTNQATGAQTTTTVSPVTDPSEAKRILDQTDARWPDLSATLVDVVDNGTAANVTTVADLVTALGNRPALAQVLSQRYYPVAVVSGLAHVDDQGQDGTTYTYEVTAQAQDGSTTGLGSVDVTTDQLTPLPAPRNPACVALDTDRLTPGGATWGQLQQRQRLFHLNVYLRWDPPSAGGQPAEWANGYDVYRAPVPDEAPAGLNSLNDLDYTRVTDEAVQPVGPQNGSSASPSTDSEDLDFFHVDETPDAGQWVYRVAPRDLLGNPRDPGVHGNQLSGPVVATSHDFDPPEPPTQINATPVANNSAVRVNWSHPNLSISIGDVSTQASHLAPPGGDVQVPDAPDLPDVPDVSYRVDEDADLSHFAVYRTTNATARPPSPSCQDESRCWVHLRNTTAGVIQDNETLRDTARWYQVRAVDNSSQENPSAWAGPTHATLHDQTPPPEPTVEVDDTYRDPNLGDPEKPDEQRDVARGVYGPTLTIRKAPQDDDTTRARLYCQFEGNSTWRRIATVNMEDADVENVQTSDHYDPPTEVEAKCRARTVDEHGNVGEPSPATDVTFGGRDGSQELPQPIVTSAQYGNHDPHDSLDAVASESDQQSTRTDTDRQYPKNTESQEESNELKQAVAGTGIPGIRVNWTYPDLANLDSFQVVREDPANGTVRTWNVSADRRTGVDLHVEPGKVYEYKVKALPRDPDNEPVESIPVQSGIAEHPQYADIRRPQRPLGHLNVTAYSNPSEDAVALDFPVVDEDRQTRAFAVFRSVHRDANYTQITPISIFGPPPVRDDPVRFQGNFTDYDVHRNYWYVVVEFDKRTGEPIRSSDPVQATNMAPTRPEPDWANVAFASGTQVPKGGCTGSAPSTGDVITFAHGFDLKVTTVTGGSGTAADGEGTATIDPPNAPAKPLDLTFRDVSVDAADNVCQGRAFDDLGGALYTTEGFTSRLHEILIGPRGTTAVVDTEVELDDTLTYDNGTTHRQWVPFADVAVHSDGNISFSAHVPGNCDAPDQGLRLETAPLLVVPDGEVALSKEEMTFSSTCTKYSPGHDSLNDTRTWVHSRSRRSVLTADPSPFSVIGGANDGYLRPTLRSAEAVTVDASGLTGTFGTSLDEAITWQPSAPSGFLVAVEGSVGVRLDDTQITSGSLTDGKVSFTHHTDATGYATSQPHQASFTRLEVDPDGRGFTNVSLEREVRWNSLWARPAQWELLLGNVTYDGDPGRALVAPHPTRVETGLTALGDARLEPGLNIRSSGETLHWTCSSGSSFETAMDAYVRHGGVSHAFRALIQGSTDQDIHGYDGSLSKWGRAFLDNGRVVQETVGSLRIPEPADVTFNLDPMTLDKEGCIKGGTGLGTKTLDYWNVTTRVDGLEFRVPDDGVPHSGDALLYALGTYEVPHLDPSSTSGAIPTQYAFLPDGDVDRSRFLLDEPTHEVDGYPFLLEGFRLSDVNEDPGWATEANIEDPPSHRPSEEGFLELQGRLLTPYFGKLTSDSGEAPNLRFTADDHYLGFDRRPRVEKTWVDLDAAELVWAYDLVYVQDPNKEAGRFTSFETYQFLPLGVLFNALEKPKDVVRQGFDRVDDRVDQAVGAAQQKAAIPFNQMRGTLGTARGEVLQGLDSANRTLTNHVDRYFSTVRTQIQNAGPNGITAEELRRNITDEAFHWFARAIVPVQNSLNSLQEIRQNELQAVLHALETAQDAVERLQSSSVDTHRMLRSVVDQLERAKTLLGPELGSLPRDLGSKNIDIGKLVNRLDQAITKASGLEQAYGQALGEVEPALDALSEGIRSIRRTVEEVDAALGDAITIGNRALSEVRGARDTLRSLVPSETAGLTASVKQSLIQETYRLQSAVKDPLHSVHHRIRTEFTDAYDTLWDRFNNTVGTVEQRIQSGIGHLGTQVKSDLDDLETLVVQVVDDVIRPIERVMSKLRLVYMDAAPVLGPQQLGSFLGLASGVAAVKGTSETRGRTWSSLSPSEQDRWRNRIGWHENRRPYGEIYGNVSGEFSGGMDHTDSVDAVDAWLQGSDPPEQDVGAGTGGLLRTWGVRIDEGRGSVLTSRVGQDDYQFEEMKLRVKAQIGEGEDPAFKADVVGMNIDRHGEYYVFGRGLETSVIQKPLSADVDLLINTSEPRFEGGLTVYDMTVEQVYIAEAGAAVGVGDTILYVGIKFDGIIRTGASQIGVGGVVLAGRVDATSPILNHHFPDAMKRVKEVPATPSSGGNEYVGMYMTAHFDMPLPPLIGAEFGCLLALNVGGRLGLWYFQSPSGDPPPLTFGIKVGGYSYGTVVCAIDARGEITVTFSFAGTIPQGQGPQGTLKVKGTTWVAAGVGDCEPGTWNGWGDRWWGDSWCAQGGAYAEVTGTGDLPFNPSSMDVEPKVEADAEGPF